MLLIALPILVVLGVVGLIVFYLSFGSIVEKAIETLGPKMTKSVVTVEHVGLSLFGGKMDVKGVVIGNPEGFNTESAFRLEHVRVVLQPTSLLSDRIVVREVLIEGPKITYEMGLTGSNIGALKRNIDDFAAKFAGEGGEEEEEPSEGGKKIRIDDFRLRNAKIALSAKLFQGKAATLPLPEVHVQDIGKDSGGKSPAEIMSEVFDVVASSITQVVTEAGAVLKEKTKELQKSAKDVGRTAQEGATKMIKGVKGLFGKDK